MEIGPGSIGLAFLAGIFTTLSPCVLPLLPLVAGGAINACAGGLFALAAGLVLSFTAIGLFVATLGLSTGIDGDVLRYVSAGLLAIIGLVLLSASLQHRLALAAGPTSRLAARVTHRFQTAGYAGQFGIGAMLGAVWSPCVGPTLGAATLLAAQGKDSGFVAVVMAAFGLGTAMPLLLVGLLSRELVQHWRGHMLGAGRAGKLIMGTGALSVAALVLTGLDRSLETMMVAASPAWLIDLTTRF